MEILNFILRFIVNIHSITPKLYHDGLKIKDLMHTHLMHTISTLFFFELISCV